MRRATCNGKAWRRAERKTPTNGGCARAYGKLRDRETQGNQRTACGRFFFATNTHLWIDTAPIYGYSAFYRLAECSIFGHRGALQLPQATVLKAGGPIAAGLLGQSILPRVLGNSSAPPAHRRSSILGNRFRQPARRG